MDIQIFQNFAIPSKMGIVIVTNFDISPVPAASEGKSDKKRTAGHATESGPPTKKHRTARVKIEGGSQVLVKPKQSNHSQDVKSKFPIKKEQTVKSEVGQGPEVPVKREQSSSKAAKENTREVEGEATTVTTKETPQKDHSGDDIVDSDDYEPIRFAPGFLELRESEKDWKKSLMEVIRSLSP